MISRSKKVNAGIIFAFFAPLANAAECFTPNGTLVPAAYQPCHPDRPSMCCALDRVYYVNSCRDDDLCFQPNGSYIWRESCTDPTWQSPQCLKLCSSGKEEGVNSHTGDVRITVCSDGSYCCGYNNKLCCDNGHGFWVANGEVYNTKPSGLVLGAWSTSVNDDITTSASGVQVSTSTATTTQATNARPSNSSAVQTTNRPVQSIPPCSDASWEPNPENWNNANVDQELALWWANTAAERQAESATFVDWLARNFGDRSRNQQCGIGLTTSCTPPDCEAFRNADGPRWVYFVRISLMEMNTLFNSMKTGIQDAETDLSLVLSDMASNFFPWKDPRRNLKKAFPWIQFVTEGVLSFVPLVGPAIKLGRRFEIFAPPILEAANEMSMAGLQYVAESGSTPIEHDFGTLKELGVLIKNSTENMRNGLDAWSRILFDGRADSTGKTILDYLVAGRFTLDYMISASRMNSLFFQLQISKLVNEQWNSTDATSRTFVMCETDPTDASLEGSLCTDNTLFIGNGKKCCLHSLNKDAEYVAPPAFDKLTAAPYNINSSDITGSSLHSYLAEGFSYNEMAITEKLARSTSFNSSEQFVEQGMAYEGIWTLPVCDVGVYSDWYTGSWAADLLPCCCGANCQETKAFVAALGVKGNAFHEKCKSQARGYDNDSARRTTPVIWGIILSIVLGLILI